MLKKGDRAIVRPSDRYNVHPVGTVVVVDFVSEIDKNKPLYATNAEGGRTSYWYKTTELEKI